MELGVVLVARNRSVVLATRSTSIILVPPRMILPLTVSVPIEAPGETVEPALAVKEPISAPLPLIVCPLPRVSAGLVDWLRSNVPATRSSSVLGGRSLLMRIMLPAPALTRLVTLAPVNWLLLLMVREFAPTPSVALPVNDTGPMIIDAPLSLVIVPPFVTAITLFNGNRLS